MITVTCEKCNSQQQVEENKIPPSGVVLTCSSCSQGITVMPPDDDDDPLLEFGGDREDDDLLDLPAPAGAAAGVSDLPTPVGLSDDIVDLPTPAGAAGIVDLPAPAGAAGITDLPTPAGREDIIDLPAPAGHRAPEGSKPTLSGMSPDDIVDLPAPAGHRAPDLLMPKLTQPGLGSPVLETDNMIDDAEPLDLGTLEPQSPEALDFGEDMLDLGDAVGLDLEPLGPQGSGAQDVRPLSPGQTSAMDLAPVGSQGSGAHDLTPVGSQGSGAHDLTPVGSQGSGAHDLAPVGDSPTFALDLQPVDPRPSTPPPVPFDASPPTGAPPLSLDDLDLVPAEPNEGVVDGLDLMPGDDASPSAGGDEATGGMSFDDLDLASGDSLTLDAPPPAAAPSQPTSDALVLDTGTPLDKGAISKAPVTVTASEGETAEPSAASRRKRRILVVAATALVVLGGGGFFGYTKYQEAQEKKAFVANGLQTTRDLLTSDEKGHWDKADETIRAVLAVAPKNSTAIGLRAQAKLAAILDEGTQRKQRLTDALAILNDGLRSGAEGPEFEKAQALRAIVENKAAEASRLFRKIEQRTNKNMPLFTGWAHLANKNMPEAKKSFTTALAMTPGRVAVLFGLGFAKVALDKKSRDEAKEHFQKILKTRPHHIGARAGLAMLLSGDDAATREGRLKEILDSQELAAGHPGHASLTWSLYGDEAYNEGRINDASERYLEAIKLDGRNLDASLGSGLCALEQGKLPEARARLDGVLAQNANEARALIGLARTSLLEQKLPDAQAFVERALKAAPDESISHLWHGHVLQAKKEIQPAKAAFEKAIALDERNYDAHVALSQLLLADNKLEEGLAVLAPVKEAAADDAPLANTLGTAYLRAEQATDAEVWFRVALTIDPNHVDARANLGVALEAQGKAGEAIAQLELAHKQSAGQREDVSLQLARAYERTRLHKQAAAIYEALTHPKSRKPTITSRAAAGRYYSRRGNIEKAAALGNSILTENQQHPAGMFLKGLGLFAKGQTNDAKKTMQNAIALDPQPQYYFRLAQVHEKQDALDDAMAAYGQAISGDPTYVEPRVGRANLRILRREFSLAMRDLESTLELAPRNAAVYMGIGKCIAALGASARDRKKAIAPLLKAVKYDPTLSETYYLLGEVYFDNDKKSDTIRSLKRFLSSNPSDLLMKIGAYRMLWLTYKARRKKRDACEAASEYLDLLPPGDASRDGAKRFLYGC